jgi:hypothetical protein
MSKRIVIAGVVLHGVKIAQAARDLGVSRSWRAERPISPKTQHFLAPLQKQDPEAGVRIRGVLWLKADLQKYVGYNSSIHARYPPC